MTATAAPGVPGFFHSLKISSIRAARWSCAERDATAAVRTIARRFNTGLLRSGGFASCYRDLRWNHNEKMASSYRVGRGRQRASRGPGISGGREFEWGHKG